MAASGKKWPDGSGLNHMSGASDPLLAALIGKLPETAKPWARADRVAWLKMMAQAFDVVYGLEGTIEVPKMVPDIGTFSLEPGAINLIDRKTGKIVQPTRQAHAGHDFYIAKDGTACRADGSPVAMSDIPADEMIFDYRPIAGGFRDRDGITWADGSQGIEGIAPGVSFCGPGAAS